MKLEFEDWIHSQKINNITKDIFSEAVSCYKNSAYRAALLLSYLGFQTIVRDRILSSSAPGGISEQHWDGLLKSLRNDEEWDSKVFDAIRMKKPSEIFSISDDVRNQILYWKNRRNDCAHSKRNEINHSHVEAFWSFLRSNLAKFVVRDSKDSLLNQVAIHFDRTLTPSGEDYSKIIEQIPNAIEPDDLETFFQEVYKALDGQFTIDDEKAGFFSAIFDLNNTDLSQSLLDFLKKENLNLLIDILRVDPRKLNLVANDQKFIRQLWYKNLFAKKRNDLHLYAALLRNDLIPADQLIEAHQSVIKNMPNVVPSQDDFLVLKDKEFFAEFRNLAFIEGKDTSVPLADIFSWANSHGKTVLFYLENFRIDDEVAKSIHSIFNKSNHPTSLASQLNELFYENPEKQKEMLTVLNKLGLDEPEHLEIENPVPF